MYTLLSWVKTQKIIGENRQLYFSESANYMIALMLINDMICNGIYVSIHICFSVRWTRMKQKVSKRERERESQQNIGDESVQIYLLINFTTGKFN